MNPKRMKSYVITYWFHRIRKRRATDQVFKSMRLIRIVLENEWNLRENLVTRIFPRVPTSRITTHFPKIIKNKWKETVKKRILLNNKLIFQWINLMWMKRIRKWMMLRQLFFFHNLLQILLNKWKRNEKKRENKIHIRRK